MCPKTRQADPGASVPGSKSILLLGGTAEANLLARRIRERHPDWRLLLSLAGRTKAPAMPEGTPTRIGGFGGARGLAEFLRTERFTHLLDATHPYAVGMSRNAAEAACLAGVERLALIRAPWTQQAGDLWQEVDCIGAARDALPHGARPFLALGSQHVAPFRHRPDLGPILRQVDQPVDLPFAATLVLGLPGTDARSEAALFSEHGATHLVCRNSGGSRSYAKIEAARALKLPVVMIRRPPEPAGPVLRTVEEVLSALAG